MKNWKPVSCALLLLGAFALHAQTYPDRPVRVISAFPPGGGVDLAGRIVALELAKRLGQAVLVENRVGAAGTVGTLAVAHSPADGYTLLVTANPSITIVPQFSKVAYDPLKELVPIAKVALSPTILCVNAQSPFRTLGDLIAATRQTPVSMGVPGAGSMQDIELAMLSDLAKAKIQSVPYRGASFIIPDVLGNQITGSALALPALVPQVKGGKMRCLGVVSGTRSQVFPDVPTVKEAIGVLFEGIPSWYGFFAPAGTPAAIVARLETEMLSIMRDPTVIARMTDLGSDSLQTGSAAFARENEAEIAAIKRAVERTKIVIQ